MYIDRRENKSKIPKVLLRESYREGNSIRKRLIADLGDLSPDYLEVLEASIHGDKLIKAEDIISKIKCTDTIPSGHIEAILTAIRRIGLPDLIDPLPCPERDIVLSSTVSVKSISEAGLMTHCSLRI
jgi:hypothetical protein